MHPKIMPERPTCQLLCIPYHLEQEPTTPVDLDALSGPLMVVTSRNVPLGRDNAGRRGNASYPGIFSLELIY